MMPLPHSLSRPLLYYITDRTQFASDENERQQKLLAKISEAAACGIDFIQLREKDLSTRELEHLARAALDRIRKSTPEAPPAKSRFLINSRTDVALAVDADGVHLRSDDISVCDARALREWFSSDREPRQPRSCVEDERPVPAPLSPNLLRQMTAGDWIIAASCHAEEEVAAAAREGAHFVVFGPVFEKKHDGSLPGLEALSRACRCPVPVLALGGVALSNFEACLEAGASGIAAIRLFQENRISEIVRHVREQ
jgi:thiamine-phosphate pyrophosphorylase